jgi:ABC-2 type transport system permease protein
MAINTKNKNNRRRQAITRIVMMVLILVCLNVLASYIHTGIDLTKEKRFTLSPSTIKMLRNMPETAVIDVYLKGKFPADLQRMQEAVREQLAAFKDVAGNKLIYHFIDPLAGKSESDQKEIVRDLQQKGIILRTLPTKEEEGYSMKVYFPYALVQYNNKEWPIALLESPPGKDRSEQITTASALLEYKFASVINLLSKPTKAHIGYLLGNDEEKTIKSNDLLNTVSAYYFLDSINLGHTIHISSAYDAVIVNQPTRPFTEPEKLKIDQYIMRGGHVLWAINQMNVSMDSFSKGKERIMGTEYGLNLDDMLFKYGVRINNDLVEDKQNVQIPFIVPSGKTEYRDWIYFPRINPTSTHPIVRNMDFIVGGFTNSIDTILTAGIKKTILLTSSKYSRTAGSPVVLSLKTLYYPGNIESFNKPYRNVAVLMEGKFHSLYQNRLAPEYLVRLDSLNERFTPVCEKGTSMIVTSIGNVFLNDYSTREGAMELGYYKFTNEYFANKSFLMNCLEYLTDHSGILEARAKDVKMRLLDKGRVKDELTMWQWINVSVPIALVLVFASCYLFFRKKKYEVKFKPAK